MKEKNISFLENLKKSFNPIDFQMTQALLSMIEDHQEKENIFFCFNQTISQDVCKEIIILLLLLSRLSQEGQLFLSIPQYANKKINPELPPLPKEKQLEEILEGFFQKGGCTLINKKDASDKPILWIEDKLYLQKNHFFLKTIAKQLKKRIEGGGAFLEKNGDDVEDRENYFIKNILDHRFFIVSGGPGSGKTTLVFKLVETAIKKNENVRIKLLAPTGKAANRLQQSLSETFAKIDKKKDWEFYKEFELTLAELIKKTETIHRFLGVQTGFTSQGNQKKWNDIVIIDEASMMTPSLLARLFLSIEEKTSLILLGDRHQLPGVNSINLIENFMETFSEETKKKCVLMLNPATGKTSHRYTEDSSIAIIAKTLRDFMNKTSSDKEVYEVLKEQSQKKDFVWNEDFLDNSEPTYAYELPKKLAMGLEEELKEHYLRYYEKIKEIKKKENSHHHLFQFFFKKMVLTSHRHGETGERIISTFIENEIVGKIPSLDIKNPYREGRVVLFLQNDYKNQIFNGDIGMILKDQKGFLKFYLYLSNRSLPVHCITPENMETLYALTIHKSQGSEFQETIIVFSEESNEETKNLLHEFFSPNLLYTALTRSKKKSTLYLNEKTLKKILSTHVSSMKTKKNYTSI